jgi:hypothetical protein
MKHDEPWSMWEKAVALILLMLMLAQWGSIVWCVNQEGDYPPVLTHDAP